MRCLPQHVASCRYLLLGWANVYGLPARDGGFAAVDAGEGAADAARGDGDVGHAQCIVCGDGQCRVLNTMLLHDVDPWSLEYLQGSGAPWGLSCGEKGKRLTDGLRGAIGDENLRVGGRVRSCSAEGDIGYNRLSWFQSRAGRTTPP